MDKYEYFWCYLKSENFSGRVSFDVEAEELYKMDKKQLCNILLMTDSQAEYVIKRKKEFNLEEEYNDFLKSGIKSVCFYETGYPTRLNALQDKPYAVFYSGELPEENVKSVAIIGARNCSEYGRKMAEIFGRELGEENINIISGMAIGIDGISQMAALNIGGKSYGVLGCGVDICYPNANKGLYERLKKDGGLISEYINGTRSKPMYFPRRNRIISGLCDCLIVVEARIKSGTSITVDCALTQGKEICVVPGRATDSLSMGCNALIKAGAYPVSCSEDVLEVLESTEIIRREIDKDYRKILKKTDEIIEKTEEFPEFMGKVERDVLCYLGYDPKDSTNISSALNIDIIRLSTILTTLEMDGYIREIDKGIYVRK